MHNTNTDRDLALIRQDLADLKELLMTLIELNRSQPATTTTRKRANR